MRIYLILALLLQVITAQALTVELKVSWDHPKQTSHPISHYRIYVCDKPISLRQSDNKVVCEDGTLTNRRVPADQNRVNVDYKTSVNKGTIWIVGRSFDNKGYRSDLSNTIKYDYAHEDQKPNVITIRVEFTIIP